jgi:hypothetical protein
VNHELDAEVIIEAFNRFAVDYVVIGLPIRLSDRANPTLLDC